VSYHEPVLAEESTEGLRIAADGIYVDVTYGGGGHSKKILQKLGRKGRLIAFDQDEAALANEVGDERLVLVNHNFRYLKKFLRYHGRFLSMVSWPIWAYRLTSLTKPGGDSRSGSKRTSICG
jgi:16S rRNA (cytosine1402-N4)-methyltransferase